MYGEIDGAVNHQNRRSENERSDHNCIGTTHGSVFTQSQTFSLSTAILESQAILSQRGMRTSTLLFLLSPPPPPSLPFFATSTQRLLSTVQLPLLATTRSSPWPNPKHAARTKTARGRRPLTATSAADDDDVEAGAGDDYDMEEDEVEELDNKKDYDVEYDRLLGSPISAPAAAAAADSSPDDIEMVTSESFVSTQGWGSDTVVDYRINEEEFHKIRLLHCDFFIRKPPDPDHNVYDFREVFSLPSFSF